MFSQGFLDKGHVFTHHTYIHAGTKNGITDITEKVKSVCSVQKDIL